HRERVEMPLEPRTLRDQRRLAGADREPTDLGLLAAERLPAQDPRQELTTEADPEHRDVVLRGPRQQPFLALDPRNRVVERGELGPERDEHVVLPRIDLAVLDVDPEDVLLSAPLLEPLVDIAARRRLLVLDDERPN